MSVTSSSSRRRRTSSVFNIVYIKDPVFIHKIEYLNTYPAFICNQVFVTHKITEKRVDSPTSSHLGTRPRQSVPNSDCPEKVLGKS